MHYEEKLDALLDTVTEFDKALDFAQTFAKRNALKHLSGIQKAPGNRWDISVLCWRPISGNIIKWDATQYVQPQKRVGDLITDNGEDFQGHHQIELKTEQERVSDEKGFESLEAKTDPENQEAIDVTPKTKESSPPTEKESLPEQKTDDQDYFADQKNIMKQYEVVAKSFPDEMAKAAKKIKSGYFNEEARSMGSKGVD